MCGIAGIIGADPDWQRVLPRMLHALQHRGPDGEGEISGPRAAFGHRRLSIIDLAGGRQPLTNADRSLWLICNGEIYNYRELRSRLEAGGYRFRTNSDCEVILGLYEQHGDALLSHLRGMFAFALWDTRRRRLLAARDHLGQKPFFYAQAAGRFLFASEIKALLAAEPALRVMNLAALDQYLALRLIAPPLSMFEGIHKLPPGHKLVLEEDREPAVEPYWDLSYEPKSQGSEEALVDELEAHLEEALRLHMVSDVPVGAFLSGGLDSSLLVAMLARRVGLRNFPTFTIGLPYRQYDEAPGARQVAQLFATDHHERTLRPSLAASLPDLVHHLDEPSDPLSLCSFQAAALAHEHVKVVIGGDGGDELFGGYDRYYGNLYADQYARLPSALRRRVVEPVLKRLPQAGWYKSRVHQLRWLHELSFHSGGERYAASLAYFHFALLQRQRLFTPAALIALDAADAEAAVRTPYERVGGAPLDRMLYADSKVRLPDHPVMITDRMSMAHGLETRSPYMDHRLAEFAARLPVRMKVRGRSLRVIQRKLAARYLPPDVLARPKQGFASALPYLLGPVYRSLFPRMLTNSSLVSAGILRGDAIRRLLDEHLAGAADHGSRLWLLVNAEIWYRMSVLSVSREDMRDQLQEGSTP
jgi:asparagine synthase (glutamine-hydrolysing)